MWSSISDFKKAFTELHTNGNGKQTMLTTGSEDLHEDAEAEAYEDPPAAAAEPGCCVPAQTPSWLARLLPFQESMADGKRFGGRKQFASMDAPLATPPTPPASSIGCGSGSSSNRIASSESDMTSNALKAYDAAMKRETSARRAEEAEAAKPSSPSQPNLKSALARVQRPPGLPGTHLPGSALLSVGNLAATHRRTHAGGYEYVDYGYEYTYSNDEASELPGAMPSQDDENTRASKVRFAPPPATAPSAGAVDKAKEKRNEGKEYVEYYQYEYYQYDYEEDGGVTSAKEAKVHADKNARAPDPTPCKSEACKSPFLPATRAVQFRQGFDDLGPTKFEPAPKPPSVPSLRASKPVERSGSALGGKASISFWTDDTDCL